MDLATLMGLRPIAGAGLLATLTRRCPLSCAHCSTASTMAAEEVDAGRLRAFLASLGAPGSQPPRVVLFTGGEPLLRPELLAELAASCRAAGTASAVLTGGFFARGGRIPDRIGAALAGLDHVSFSLDVFHEREVERADVFAALRLLLDRGQRVSLHVLGTDSADPYLTDVTSAVRQRFGAAVPMLVSEVRSVGRASAWTSGRLDAAVATGPVPCALAAWPVIAFDGTVLACCNQRVVDARPVPQHLWLGHLDTDDWTAVRDRLLSSPMLRMVRTSGPLQLRARFTDGTPTGDTPTGAEPGYCGTCRLLSDQPAVVRGAALAAAGPSGQLLDREVGLLQHRAGPVALIRRYGSARYAELVAPV